MSPSTWIMDQWSFEQDPGFSGIDASSALQLESWNTVAAMFKNTNKKPMEQPIRKKLSPKKPITRKYRLGQAPYSNDIAYQTPPQTDRCKKEFHEHDDASDDDGYANTNDYSNAIAQNRQVIQDHQALHDHKDGHDNGESPASVPVFASYEVAKGANSDCHPDLFMDLFMDAVQDTNMNLGEGHPIFEGMKRSFAQMQIQPSPTWPQPTIMTQDATFEPFIFGQSSATEYSATDENLAGNESPIKYQKIGDKPFFPHNTVAVLEGSRENESSVMGPYVREGEVTLWSLLDSLDTIDFNQEGLPGADAEPMKHRDLIPAGLFCTAETTKQVPEYKVQEISQGLDRPISQEAIFDTSMSTDTKACDESVGGPLSDSPAQFTRDLRSELDKIRGAIENVAAKPFGAVQVRERINAGPSPHQKLFGTKGLLVSSPTVSTPKASSPGAKKSPRQKTGHKKVSRRVREWRSKVVPQNPIMSQASLLTGSPQSDVQFGLTVPPEWRRASLPLYKQSEMFSDIELLICKTANDFLVQQYHHDRVSDHSINRAKRAWDAKNRPPVEEFNFDQATQRQLIVDNRESIYFPQEMRGNGALISTILRQWKAIIAQTKIRTCPMSDTGINMTLQDVKGVLEMLNACPKAMRCYHAIARWITRRLKLPRPTLPIIPEHRTIEIIQEHGANSRN